jgi:uncharacterized membrane protein HdeD (DUF308 family)
MKGYRNAVVTIAVVTIVLGLVIVVSAAAQGGSLGVVVGLLFVCAGAARLYLARRRR